MRLIKVGAAVLNQTPLDWDQNLKNMIDVVESAKSDNVDVLCLPELCVTGYGCEDAFHSVDVRRTAREVLFEWLPHTSGIAVSAGLPIMHRNGLFNAACLAVDGEIAGFFAKQHLAGDGLHYEPRWFKPWPENRRARIDARGLPRWSEDDDVPILEAERRFRWPAPGPRPEGHPGLAELGL